MKFEMFHLMPYRDLPHDFNEKHHSVWVDVPSRLFDPAKAHRMYNDTLDELELGASAGYDGICVNEHHNNAYGMMPSPNLMLASLARRTEDVALIVLDKAGHVSELEQPYALADVVERFLEAEGKPARSAGKGRRG